MPGILEDERIIRLLIEAWAAAVRRKDLDAILRHHASDFVMFDVPPPFESKGLEAYKRTWTLFFGSSPETPVFDIRRLDVVASGEVAFAIALMRCVDRGEPLDFRLTIGFRRISGQWMFVHEHHSVPSG